MHAKIADIHYHTVLTSFLYSYEFETYIEDTFY